MPKIVYMCAACGDLFVRKNAAKNCCTPFAISRLQDMYYYAPDSLTTMNGETLIPMIVFDDTKYEYMVDVKRLAYIPYDIQDYVRV